MRIVAGLRASCAGRTRSRLTSASLRASRRVAVLGRLRVNDHVWQVFWREEVLVAQGDVLVCSVHAGRGWCPRW